MEAINPTALQQANLAYQQQNFAQAIQFYVQVLLSRPALAPLLINNLYRAQKSYHQKRAQQLKTSKPHILVSCWDLANNPVGRAATLGPIWQQIAEVEIIGCLYPPHRGKQIWQPLQDFSIPIHSLTVKSEHSFIQQAISFVSKHPCDLLHLSKPRLPNIFIGLLYKLIWACPVIMDIDDEELAFVNAVCPLTLEDYLGLTSELADTTPNLWNKTSTQLGMNYAQTFDAVTTVNPALQQRYGGAIIHHARDAQHLSPSLEKRQQARNQLGITENETVIVFAGTPRKHKGLLDVAKALAKQKRQDLTFLILGSFPKETKKLEEELTKLPNLKKIMRPNFSFNQLPNLLAAGDITILLQDPNSLAAQMQTPAKLTDALAMGLTVLATPTPGLAGFLEEDAFIPIEPDKLNQALAQALAQHDQQKKQPPKAHPLFKQQLSLEANSHKLKELYLELKSNSTTQSVKLTTNLHQLAEQLPSLAPLLTAPNPQLPSKQKKTTVNWQAASIKPRQTNLTSIIIPIYNQPELTAACIEALYQHTAINTFELILVDNGSDAPTKKLLEKTANQYPNIQLLSNPTNLNFAQGCNQGAALSNGQTLLFLNNDTTVTNNWLPPLLTALQQPDIAAVQPQLLYPDGTIQNIGVVFSSKSALGYPIYAHKQPSELGTIKSRRYQALTAACLAINADDFNQLKGFDTAFINGQEDIDLCLRLNQHHGKISCWLEATSQVIHHESKSQNRFKHVDQNRRFFVERWQKQMQADDQNYYNQDGYQATSYQADSKNRPTELQIWRPLLQKISDVHKLAKQNSAH